MRVWEIAKRLGMESKTVRALAQEVGVTTKSASTKIEPLCAQTLIAYVLFHRRFV